MIFKFEYYINMTNNTINRLLNVSMSDIQIVSKKQEGINYLKIDNNHILRQYLI
jgi:hypothetical protein